MAGYCSRTDISNALPVGHVISDENLDILISEATAWVDSGLCVRYWSFPVIDTDAGTAPPAIIRSIARLFGQWLAWTQYLSASGRFMPDTVRELLSEAETQISKLVMDPPLYNIPAVTLTEELAFGSTLTVTLEDDEHLLGCSPRDVVAESVLIAGHENGADFRVYYKRAVRSWVLQRLTDDIVDGDSVTYNYTFMRRREQDLPPSVDTVRLSRA